MAPHAETPVSDQARLTFQKKKENRYIQQSVTLFFPKQEKAIKIQSLSYIQASPLSEQYRQTFHSKKT
jgi:hypothetical protein